MNETEWISWDDRGLVFQFLRGRRDWSRKLYLYAVACLRDCWPVLSDPSTRRLVDVLERFAPSFAEWGMSGIEVVRPNTSPTDGKRIRGVARGLGMFATGGSDWHGPWRSRLGDFFVPADEVRELLDLAPTA